MAKIATAAFPGASNIKYSFNVYEIDTEFKALSVVYCFTKRTMTDENKGQHEIIFVGNTDDLSSKFLSPSKESCVKKHEANCICIMQEDNTKTRKEIEEDLIKKYNPLCNR